MRKILDLSQFEEQTMEVRVNENLSLNLQKPTQAIVIEMLKFKNIDENTDAETIMKALDSLCLLILNTNDSLVKYTKQKMNQILNTQQKVMIVTAYSEFIAEVQNHPN